MANRQEEFLVRKMYSVSTKKYLGASENGFGLVHQRALALLKTKNIDNSRIEKRSTCGKSTLHPPRAHHLSLSYGTEIFTQASTHCTSPLSRQRQVTGKLCTWKYGVYKSIIQFIIAFYYSFKIFSRF